MVTSYLVKDMSWHMKLHQEQQALSLTTFSTLCCHDNSVSRVTSPPPTQQHSSKTSKLLFSEPKQSMFSTASIHVRQQDTVQHTGCTTMTKLRAPNLGHACNPSLSFAPNGCACAVQWLVINQPMQDRHCFIVKVTSIEWLQSFLFTTWKILSPSDYENV